MKTQAYIDKIIEKTGLSKKEIQERVEEKIEELKGLISDEGALFIIAKELGVNVKEETREIIDDFEINIADVTPNMKNLTLVGRIKEVHEPRMFTRKDGTEGMVGSFILHDETGDIRIVMWNEQVKIFEFPDFKLNGIVKILNSYVKKGLDQKLEIHVGRLGRIILNPEDVDYNKYPKITHQFTSINEIHLSLSSISIEGKILQITPIREFTRNDGTSGKVASMYISDKTGSIRVTFWNEDTMKIKNLEAGNIVSLTALNPRINKLDPNKIDLHATSRTTIQVKEKTIELKENYVENIKKIQDTENIISVKGVITSIDNLKTITLKSGENVNILNFVLSDDKDSVRVVMWRDQAEKFSESLAMGMGVALKNVLIRFNSFSNKKELTFLNGSELEKIDVQFADLKIGTPVRAGMVKTSTFSGHYTPLKDINSTDIFEVKGYIARELRDKDIIIYDACSNCLKKIDNCTCSEKGEPIKRMIIKTFIDDGTDTIKTIFFGNQAEALIGLGANEVQEVLETEEFLHNLSKELMGRDLIIKGRGVFNDFNDLNRYELNVIDFKNLDVDEELAKLIEEIEL
ncbi:MAG: DUF2240 family protein [Promethearchaeota archaeon]